MPYIDFNSAIKSGFYPIGIDKQGESFTEVFYIEADDEFYKLENVKEYIDGDFNRYKKNERYKGVLKYVLQDDGIENRRIERTPFALEYLTKLLLETGDAEVILPVTRTPEPEPDKERGPAGIGVSAEVGYPLVLSSVTQKSGLNLGGLLSLEMKMGR